MNKLSWGSLAIILGSIVLSLQLYGLTLYANAISFDPEGLLKYNTLIRSSMAVMCALIVYGMILVVLHIVGENQKK